MTHRQKHVLYKSLNATFRIGGPIGAAIHLWGFGELVTGQPVTPSQTFFTLAGGAFVALLMIVIEGRTFLKKQIAQFRVDTKTVAQDNHTLFYAFMGGVMLAVQQFADKAMVFFFAAAASNAVAQVFEQLENKHYRLAFPEKG